MKDFSKLAALALWTTAALGVSGAAIADNGGLGSMMEMGRGMDLDAMFGAVDADKDGKVTPDEIGAYKAERLAKVDVNKDGLLSEDELVQMQIQAFTEKAKVRSAAMIEKMDTNSDGLLSATELEAGPGMTMMLAFADTDKDGAISKAEMESVQGMMAKQDGRGHSGMGHHGGKHGGFWSFFGGEGH